MFQPRRCAWSRLHSLTAVYQTTTINTLWFQLLLLLSIFARCLYSKAYSLNYSTYNINPLCTKFLSYTFTSKLTTYATRHAARRQQIVFDKFRIQHEAQHNHPINLICYLGTYISMIPYYSVYIRFIQYERLWCRTCKYITLQ